MNEMETNRTEVRLTLPVWLWRAGPTTMCIKTRVPLSTSEAMCSPSLLFTNTDTTSSTAHTHIAHTTFMFSWINLRYSSLNVFQLTWILSLHYLVQLAFVFCKWTAIGTANPKNTPNVFVTLSTKPGQLWYNFVLNVLNIFATENYKSFPPHLNDVSYYLVKLNIHVFVKILMLEKRNSRNFAYYWQERWY